MKHHRLSSEQPPRKVREDDRLLIGAVRTVVNSGTAPNPRSGQHEGYHRSLWHRMQWAP